MADAIHAGLSEKDVQEIYWPVVSAVGQLLRACEACGAVRPGTDPEDLLVLLSCLWRSPQSGQADRLLQLIFRGLGADQG